MRPVGVGHVVSPAGTNRDLDGVHDQQPEFPVEHIEVENVIKADAGAQSMRLVIGLGRQPVGSQPIVVEMTQIVEGPFAIRHCQPPLDEPVELVIEAQRGLVELQGRPPEKSNPPRCASGRGVGGVVTKQYKDAKARCQVSPIRLAPSLQVAPLLHSPAGPATRRRSCRCPQPSRRYGHWRCGRKPPQRRRWGY